MSASGPDRLYDLLPALYRARDGAAGQPLRALLGVMGKEYDRVHASIQKLEDAWFIETCDPGVIPFIAELVGVDREELARVPARTQRAFVGNAIRLRRRKGIAAAMERAIGDATGWTAHTVEMFEHLGMTQSIDHPNLERRTIFDVRGVVDTIPEPGVKAGAYTAGVGRAGLRTLAVFVSRLQSYPVEQSEPFRVREGCYTFHPLGLDTPLFTQPGSDDDPLRPHGFTDLSSRIPRGALAADLAAYEEQRAAARRDTPVRAKLDAGAPSAWVGAGMSIDVQRPTASGDAKIASLDPENVVAADLSRWDAPGWKRPDAGHVAVDVDLGRLALGPPAPGGPLAPEVRVSWSFGRVDDLGAGPYPRDPAREAPTWPAEVAKHGSGHVTLRDAVAAWNEAVRKHDPKDRPIVGRIRIADSSTYGDPVPVIHLGVHALRIEAEVGEVPTVTSPITVNGDKGGSLVVEGLQLGAPAPLEARVPVPSASTSASAPRPSGSGGSRLRAAAGLEPPLPDGRGAEASSVPVSLLYSGRLQLSLVSCTVHGAIKEEKARPRDLLTGERVTLTLTRCLAGPVRMAGPTGLLTVSGSIVDGRGGPAIAGLGVGSEDEGPAVALSRTTVLGDVSAEVVLQAEECLFTGMVTARRVQASVLRFSAVPYASNALPRYRSVLFGAPAGADEPGAIAGEPRFGSLDLCHPAYGRLERDGPPEILRGAEDGGEMGAWHDAGEALRRAALDAVLDDFLPHNLSATVVFID